MNDRQKISKNYINLIKKNQFLKLPISNSESSYHSWNQFVIRIKNLSYSSEKKFSELFETDFIKNNSFRNALKKKLLEKGINSIIYYPIPIHAQEAYKNNNYDRENLLNTELISTEVLSLPMYPELSFEEQKYIAENLNLILKEFVDDAQMSA